MANVIVKLCKELSIATHQVHKKFVTQDMRRQQDRLHTHLLHVSGTDIPWGKVLSTPWRCDVCQAPR